MEQAIRVEQLTKHFKEFTLDHVSFSLPKGYIMGLIGKNGSGKTTTIQLLLRMLAKDDGHISILGKQVEAQEQAIKQEIAVVFDDVFFVESWKVRDVESAIAPFYPLWDSTLYHQYVSQFQLSLDKSIQDLSRGMKMKLMLAVALSRKAKLLILDEPTSGLDPVARDELMDILLRYVEDAEHSVLFSTHITTDLDKIADYLTVLQNGKVFYSGEKDALKEQYCIVKGDPSEVSVYLKSHLIGYRSYSTGFEAMLKVSDMALLTSNMVCEELSLDDILIFLNQSQEEI